MSSSTFLVDRELSLADVAAAVYGLRSEWRRIYDANPGLTGLVTDGETPIRESVRLTIPAIEPRPLGPGSGGGPFRLLVRASVGHLEGRKLLQESVSELHGVGQAAADLLAKIGVRSIFDLAQARPFNAVLDLLDDAGTEATYAQHGFLPGDLLRGDPRRVPDIEAFLAASLDELDFHQPPGSGFADALAQALPAPSIRDLALWPPFRAARAIFDGTFNAQAGAVEDPEAPSDLLPRTGNYATERVQYQSVVMTRLAASDADVRALESAGGVQLGASAVDELGAVGPAEGAIITTEQAWYAQGVTLGQLLHSLALAPGESTRIAMVDWTRRTSARSSSSTSQIESLAQSTVQARSISEITDAIAQESQHGASQVKQESTAESASRSTNVGGGGSVSAAFFGFGGSASRGTNQSIGHSFGVATSVSRSSADRKVSARTAQRVAASTRQHATAARSRRATIVQETFESEKEVATTRVITNYNHMHALSVQYYEVVQAYRVRTQVLDYDRVIFVPMRPMNFNDPDTIERYRSTLWRFAPLVEWHPEQAGTGADGEEAPAAATAAVNGKRLRPLIEGWRRPTEKSTFEGTELIKEVTDGRLVGISLRVDDGRPAPRVVLVRADGRDETIIDVGSGLPAQNNEVFRLGDVKALRVVFPRGATAPRDVTVDLQISGTWGTSLERRQYSFPVRLAPVEAAAEARILSPEELEMVNAVWTWASSASPTVAPELTEEAREPTEVEARHEKEAHEHWSALASAGLLEGAPPGGRSTIPKLLFIAGSLREGHERATKALSVPPPSVSVFTVSTTKTFSAGHEDLVRQLSEDALFFSQAIWLSSSPMDLSRALAGYSFEGGPLVARLDPRPVAVTGNYLGFKWMFNDAAERAAWMEAEGFSLDASNAEDTMVPLPTGGVFAEAVLGRFNAAEKVDLTRFWNWQESPIPIKPSEIAPIKMVEPQGGAAPATDRLAAPAVHLAAPAPLPEPTGMAAAMNALTAANMFRDMSGLTQSAALVEAAGRTAAAHAQRANELSGEGARHAAEEATKALEAGMKHQEKMAELAIEAAPLIAAPMTGGASLAGLGATKAGGLMNMASKLDAADRGSGGAGGNAKSAFSGLLGRLGGLVGRR